MQRAVRLAATLTATALTAALTAAAPAAAQPVDALQQGDARVQTIGWRLARANAAYCAHAAPQIGLLLQDARTFTDADAARQAYGLSGDIAVGAVAADGPAARAGLDANTTITAVAGQPVAALPVPRLGRWDRLLALQDRLEQAAARDGRADLTLAGGRTVTITGEAACPVRFLLDDDKGNAAATRKVARIGRDFIAELGDDPDLVAAVLAHELAHAVLDHQSLLEASHRSLDVVRRTEREADRLSVWLLANAGYDPQLAVRMIGVIGPKHQFLVGSPTHGGWRRRARDMTNEIAALHAAPDANWPIRFRRET